MTKISNAVTSHRRLYKPLGNGTWRTWAIVTNGPEVIVEFGVDGGVQTRKSYVAEAKNIGRVNARSPVVQAQLEAKGKWTEMIERNDYHFDKNLAGTQFRPELASDYLKNPEYVDWNNAVTQPKLDGMRLSFGSRWSPEAQLDHALDEELMSRRGLVYPVEHLREACSELRRQVSICMTGSDRVICWALDGEVYKHGWTLQAINSATRRIQKKTLELSYYVFDICVPDLVYADRVAILSAAMNIVAPKYPVLKQVLGTPVSSDEELIRHHSMYVTHGFEGAIIRNTTSHYGVGQRSANLIKYKQFDDTECEIVGMEADRNGNAVFTCRHPNGAIFGCTPKRSHAERSEMLMHKDIYIGRWITVKHQGLTIDGVPAFPVGLDFRDCDENGRPLY